MKIDWNRIITPGIPLSKNRPTFHKWFVFSAAIGLFLLDNLAVAGGLTSLTEIQRIFNVSSSTATWVYSSYALTLGSFIIIFGKLADIVGSHVVCFYGGVFMSICSLLIAAVQTSVIASAILRALQGIGGSAVIPCAYTFCATYFEGKQFHYAVNLFTVVATGGFGIGLVLGGALGFAHFFYFNFALGIFCSVLLYFSVIAIETPKEYVKPKLRNLNYPVVFLLVGSLVVIIYGFIEASNGWNSPKVYVTLPVGVVAFVSIFVFENVFLRGYQKKHPRTEENQNDWLAQVDQFFPIEIFRITNFVPLFFGLFLLYFSFTTILFTGVQYFQDISGNSPLMAGVKLLPFSTGMTICAISTSERFFQWLGGHRNAIIASSFISLCGAIWVMKLDCFLKNEYWIIWLGSMALLGFGCNFYFKLYMICIMGETPPSLHGLATGIFQTGGQAAVTISSSICSTILGNLKDVSEAEHHIKKQEFEKFRNVMWMHLAINIVFFLLMFTLKPEKVGKEEKEEEASKLNEEDEEKQASNANTCDPLEAHSVTQSFAAITSELNSKQN